MKKREIYLLPVSNKLSDCQLLLHVLALQNNKPLNKNSNAKKLHQLLIRSANDN